MTTDIEGLIERLEKATGPSRELDRDIAHLINWYPSGITDIGCYHDPAAGCTGGEIYKPPAFTASIDAALTTFRSEELALWELWETLKYAGTKQELINGTLVAALRAHTTTGDQTND